LEQKESLWTKDFILICLANMIMFISFYLLLPTLPVFVIDVLKGDKSKVGYIIGILSLTAVLVRPVSGYMLDTLSRKKVLLVALLAFILSMAAYNFVTGLTLLLVLRALHGFSWGFTTTGAGTIAADVVPPTRRGEGMGYFGLSNTFSMAIGPSLGLFIINKAGFTSLFNACVLTALLALLFVLPISYKEQITSKDKSIMSLNSFFEAKVFSLSAMIFFIAVVYGGIVSFITIYVMYGVIKNAGTFFLVYALTLLLVRPIAGKTFDKNGPLKIMALGFISISMAFVLLFIAKGNTLFLLSAVSMGIGFGIVHPTAMAMAINRVKPYRRGAANATIMSAFDLGIGLGSIFLGILSDQTGMSYMYLTCSLIILIPLVMFYLIDAREFIKKRETKHHSHK
jgi:predicted MFS family arabinose efflux permease